MVYFENYCKYKNLILSDDKTSKLTMENLVTLLDSTKTLLPKEIV